MNNSLRDVTSSGVGVTEAPSVDSAFQGPKEASLLPLYHVTNYVLEQAFGGSNLTELDNRVGLSNMTSVMTSLRENYAFWLRHYIAYTVCVGIGVALALALPVAGCVVCCRKRGKCGGKDAKKMDGKFTNCARGVLGVALLLIAALALLGNVAAFLTNEVMYAQTADRGRTGLVGQALALTDRLNRVTDDVRGEYTNRLPVQLNPALTAARTAATRLPHTVTAAATAAAGCTPALNTLRDVVTSLNVAMTQLEELTNQSTPLNTSLQEVAASVMAFRWNTTQLLGQCAGIDPHCNSSYSYVQNVTSGMASWDYDVIDSVNLTLRPLSDDFLAAVNATMEAYDVIREEIGARTSSEVITRQINVFEQEVDRIADVVIATVSSFQVHSLQNYINTTVAASVEKGGTIRYWSSIGLSSLPLLLIALIILGLRCGSCGHRVGADGNCCSRGNGSCLLHVGVGLLCALSWVVLLSLSLLLVSGGVVHNDLCRPLLSDARTSSRATISQIMTQFLVTNRNVNFNHKLLDLYEGCKQGKTVYTVFKIHEIQPELNISLLAQTLEHDVKSSVDYIQNQNFTVGNWSLVSPALISSIPLLVNELTGNISDALQSMSDGLRPLANPSVSHICAHLSAQASTSGGQIASLFGNLTDACELLQTTVVMPTEALIAETRRSLTEILKLRDAIARLGGIPGNLQACAGHIDGNLIAEAVRNATDALHASVGKMAADSVTLVRTQLARCRGSADAVDDVVAGLCVRALWPFNGFWFSHVCSLFFLLLALPLSLRLAALYQRPLAYKPEEISEPPEDYNPPRGQPSMFEALPRGQQSQFEDEHIPRPSYHPQASRHSNNYPRQEWDRNDEEWEMDYRSQQGRHPGEQNGNNERRRPLVSVNANNYREAQYNHQAIATRANLSPGGRNGYKNEAYL